MYIYTIVRFKYKNPQKKYVFPMKIAIIINKMTRAQTGWLEQGLHTLYMPVYIPVYIV